MANSTSVNPRRETVRQPFRRCVQVVCLALFVYLLFFVCWPYSAAPSADAVIDMPHQGVVPAHYAQDLARKEAIPAEVFLALDPLVSVSAAIAGRVWTGALWGALAVGLLGLLVPRAFCSYICPLGTTLDVVDLWAAKLTAGKRLRDRGWGNVRFAVLVAVLLGAVFGVLLSGFVAAIPVVTRGMVFIVAPVQTGLLRGWHNVPPVTAGVALSIVLFVAIPALGLVSRRFWCRSVCPSGALLSLVNLLTPRRRRVSDACVACGKCRTVCSFDAIRDDFQADVAACTFCRACENVCPVEAIGFSCAEFANPRPRQADVRAPRGWLRRQFVGAAVTGPCSALGFRYGLGSGALPLVRPPGSLPEREFLGTCVRCGECIRACPNNVLHPVGLARGLDGLWSPCVLADWSGCEPSCNNCGQVCPTGAIRALPLAEKRAARMGLAEIDKTVCLPWASGSECQLCVDECRAAQYNAIEFERIGVAVDDEGFPIEGTGVLAPVIVPERCVGCGLCQTRCYRINAKAKRLTGASAIKIHAGAGCEDRITRGSYLDLREKERRERLERGRELEESV